MPDEATPRRLLEQTRRDGYLLTRHFPPADGARATSYFGATPRLPPELDWPVASGGRPLNFLAQIDLAALPPLAIGSPLPSHGTLFFFVDACNDRDDGPPGPVWAAVRYASGRTAALPMRPAPARLPPLFPGYGLFPWIRDRDPMVADEPSTYPFWPIDPRPVRNYNERVPSAIDRDAQQVQAYQEAWALAEEEALAEAIGEPARFLAPSDWSERNRGRFDFAPIRPWDSRSLWLPDDAWPYAWIHIRIFTAELLRALDSVERSLESQLKHRSATPAAVADARAIYARAGAMAEGWYTRARTHFLLAPVPSADRAAFVAWLQSIEQPYSPEWSQRDPNARRFRLLVDGSFHILDAIHLNEWTGRALIQGAHASIGYAVPGTSPPALPPHLLRMLRPAYAASQLGYDGRRRLARHQLLGIPVTVQTAVDEVSPTHQLLAQFEHDDILFFPPGEGTVQFWITPDDLAARRFHQSIATIEST